MVIMKWILIRLSWRSKVVVLFLLMAIISLKLLNVLKVVYRWMFKVIMARWICMIIWIFICHHLIEWKRSPIESKKRKKTRKKTKIRSRMKWETLRRMIKRLMPRKVSLIKVIRKSRKIKTEKTKMKKLKKKRNRRRSWKRSRQWRLEDLISQKVKRLHLVLDNIFRVNRNSIHRLMMTYKLSFLRAKRRNRL